MRRAMPTRPLWPLKNSQSASHAARAIALTRPALCDSESLNTFSPLAAPAGRMASRAFMSLHIDLRADHGDAAADVGPVLDIGPVEGCRVKGSSKLDHVGGSTVSLLGGLHRAFRLSDIRKSSPPEKDGFLIERCSGGLPDSRFRGHDVGDWR